MADAYEEYIMWSRLFVVIQFVTIPLYFFTLTFLLVEDYNVPFLDGKFLELGSINITQSDVLVYFIGPVVLTMPLLLWTYLERNRIADTYSSLWGRVWTLPVTIKSFYGLNCLIGLSFVLPFVAPLIALFGGYFLGIILFGKSERLGEKSTTKLSKILGVIYFPIPALIAFGFYWDVLPFLYEEIVEAWWTNLELIYQSSLILADVVVLTSMLFLYFEYQQQQDYHYRIPTRLIYFVGIILFVCLEAILFQTMATVGSSDEFRQDPVGDLFWYFHKGVLVIGIGVFLIRYLLRLHKGAEFSLSAWVSILLFQAIDLLPRIIGNSFRTIAVGLAGLLFFLMFLLTYREAGRTVGRYA
ncbi:MAG: hypothetical protein ACFFCQ_14150 [Promethearchaeota archaeon]